MNVACVDIQTCLHKNVCTYTCVHIYVYMRIIHPMHTHALHTQDLHVCTYICVHIHVYMRITHPMHTHTIHIR